MSVIDAEAAVAEARESVVVEVVVVGKSCQERFTIFREQYIHHLMPKGLIGIVHSLELSDG